MAVESIRTRSHKLSSVVNSQKVRANFRKKQTALPFPAFLSSNLDQPLPDVHLQ